MSYTTKDLAEKCGITPTYVLKYIRTHGLDDRLEKSGKSFVIPDDVAQQLLAHFEVKEAEKQNDESDKLTQVLEQQIADLREQLKIKDEQIKFKDEQILSLTQTVQDLTATNKALAQAEVKRMFAGVSRSNEIILADAQVVDTQQTTQEQAQPKQEKKRGFWARLFGLD